MRKKHNVILDLDNTLISAEAIEDFPFTQPIKEKSEKFTVHDMDGYYIVFERPYLQEFLDYLFENYNVAVWTAASKDYALFIIDRIVLKKPDRKLDFILFSYHCELSRQRYGTSKQLKFIFDVLKPIGYNENNSLIVDDLKDVYNCQPKNAINIHPFEFLKEGSENDNHLADVIRKIKKIFEQS